MTRCFSIIFSENVIVMVDTDVVEKNAIVRKIHNKKYFEKNRTDIVKIYGYDLIEYKKYKVMSNFKEMEPYGFVCSI